jgi:hypothetical protein
MKNVRFIGLGLLLAMTAVQAEALQTRDRISKREERAQIARKFSAFVSKGDLLAARSFMEENKLIEKRIVGSYEAAIFYYEIEEFDLATNQIELLKSERKPKEFGAFYQTLLNWRLLIRAAQKGVAPDWTALPNQSIEGNPTQYVRAMAYAALGQFHFRTAEYLMKELPKLGADPVIMKELTARLTEKRLEQKKLQEADKLKPASNPKPGA